MAFYEATQTKKQKAVIENWKAFAFTEFYRTAFRTIEKNSVRPAMHGVLQSV